MVLDCRIIPALLDQAPCGPPRLTDVASLQTVNQVKQRQTLDCVVRLKPPLQLQHSVLIDCRPLFEPTIQERNRSAKRRSI